MRIRARGNVVRNFYHHHFSHYSGSVLSTEIWGLWVEANLQHLSTISEMVEAKWKDQRGFSFPLSSRRKGPRARQFIHGQSIHQEELPKIH